MRPYTLSDEGTNKRRRRKGKQDHGETAERISQKKNHLLQHHLGYHCLQNLLVRALNRFFSIGTIDKMFC